MKSNIKRRNEKKKKESTCSAGDTGDVGSIPGSERSFGGGHGNPLQYSCLSWEDPLEKEMATHYSILDWEIPWTEQPGGLQSMGC